MITVNANAKINLTLDIVGKQQGYHILDMLVASISLADEVTVVARNDNLNFCYMDGVLADEKNSALCATYLMQSTFKLNGFDVYIKKNIPMCSGLGGSTADGVAVIKAISTLMDINPKKITSELLIKIGSDAPCMYNTGVKRVQGIGEKITEIGHTWPYNVGIIAGNGVSTPMAYKLFDDMNLIGSSSTSRLLTQMEKGKVNLGRYMNNDLLMPAIRLNNDIKTAIDYMKTKKIIGYNMSGSGSAVFGLFEGEVPDNIIKAKML